MMRKLIILFIFYGYMPLNGILVCVNGSPCAGKSSIIRKFMDIAVKKKLRNWRSISLDECLIENQNKRRSCGSALKILIRVVRVLLAKKFNVICDFVVRDEIYSKHFFKNMPDVEIIKVFIDCKLDVLLKRLEMRNLNAKKNEDFCDVRTINQIFDFIRKTFSVKNSDERLNKICSEQIVEAWEYVRGILLRESFECLNKSCCDFDCVLNSDYREVMVPGFRFGNYDLIVDNSVELGVGKCAEQIWNRINN